MSLRAILFTGPAERQLDEVLEDSEEHFGVTARERYEALFAQAFDDLLDNPGRPGVRRSMAACIITSGPAVTGCQRRATGSADPAISSFHVSSTIP